MTEDWRLRIINKIPVFTWFITGLLGKWPRNEAVRVTNIFDTKNIGPISRGPIPEGWTNRVRCRRGSTTEVVVKIVWSKRYPLSTDLSWRDTDPSQVYVYNYITYKEIGNTKYSPLPMVLWIPHYYWSNLCKYNLQ